MNIMSLCSFLCHVDPRMLIPVQDAKALEAQTTKGGHERCIGGLHRSHVEKFKLDEISVQVFLPYISQVYPIDLYIFRLYRCIDRQDEFRTSSSSDSEAGELVEYHRWRNLISSRTNHSSLDMPRKGR